ncbi:MAG: hypothetical protein ABIG32_02645, partial [Candidatus Uhrbacteria bacterium]
ECQYAFLLECFNVGAKIGDSLKSLSNLVDENGNQMDSNRFEVMIVVNQFAGCDKENREANKETLRTISTFLKTSEAKGVHVHTIFKNYDQEAGRAEAASKLGTDLIKIRQYQRTVDANAFGSVKITPIIPGEPVKL